MLLFCINNIVLFRQTVPEGPEAQGALRQARAGQSVHVQGRARSLDPERT